MKLSLILSMLAGAAVVQARSGKTRPNGRKLRPPAGLELPGGGIAKKRHIKEPGVFGSSFRFYDKHGNEVKVVSRRARRLAHDAVAKSEEAELKSQQAKLERERRREDEELAKHLKGHRTPEEMAIEDAAQKKLIDEDILRDQFKLFVISLPFHLSLFRNFRTSARHPPSGYFCVRRC